MMEDWLAGPAVHYLRRLIRSEAIMESQPSCLQCHSSGTLYRCRDCQVPRAQCSTCLKDSHRLSPSHRIRRWTGDHFEDCELPQLGFVFELGHNGQDCNLGSLQSFTLVDITGIHKISVRFCRHKNSGDHARQLMDARIYPASDEAPTTGFTFALLKQFSLLTVIAKVPAEGYYNVLVSQTNPCFPQQVPDRYREFMRVSRQWQHLCDLKRSGFTSIDGTSTQTGDLALRCPACPRPFYNYDPDLVLTAFRCASAIKQTPLSYFT